MLYNRTYDKITLDNIVDKKVELITMKSEINLSQEQKEFVDCALSGNNILVDACIGSGMTTSIQKLCDYYPREKRILYLTYNKLLKLDARTKIKKRRVSLYIDRETVKIVYNGNIQKQEMAWE